MKLISFASTSPAWSSWLQSLLEQRIDGGDKSPRINYSYMIVRDVL